MSARNPLLDAALRYARRGWRVYPSPAKNGPAHVKWGTEATTDQQTITAWWTRWPQALVCIACGPSVLAVIDLDVKDGHNGPAVFAALQRRRGDVPATLTQTTASGGTHLIFKGTIKTTAGVLGDGIDTRGVGGMIVAAPSVGYTMHDDAELGDVPEPADLPLWLADLAGRIPNKPHDTDQAPAVDLDTDEQVKWAIHYLTHDAKASIEGRNGEYALLMTAGVLKDLGISEDKSIELLAEFYNVPPPQQGEPMHPYCDPLWGLGDGPVADRLDIKVHNAWLYLRQNRPGELTPEAVWGDGEADDTDPTTWGPGYSVDASGVVRFTPANAADILQANADKYVRDHYTVVNGKLYPKQKPRKGWKP